MKVSEYIELLKNLDQEATVMCPACEGGWEPAGPPEIRELQQVYESAGSMGRFSDPDFAEYAKQIGCGVSESRPFKALILGEENS